MVKPVPLAGGPGQYENIKIGLLILGVFIVLGLILFGVYKLFSAAGVKPASKNTGEQCGVNLECVSQKCLFGKCI